MPEVVQHAATGWLVAHDTPEAWAAGLAAAASRETAARFGAAARVRVAEHFTIEAMCQGYGAVYGELTA
jgi:glycosyltransferase involved in cell wall biosynthesis